MCKGIQVRASRSASTPYITWLGLSHSACTASGQLLQPDVRRCWYTVARTQEHISTPAASIRHLNQSRRRSPAARWKRGIGTTEYGHYWWQWDEISMLPRHEFAYLEQRYAMARHSTASTVLPEIAQRNFGGIPVCTLFGDAHQLPPVARPSLFDTNTKTKGDQKSSNGLEKLHFRQFLKPAGPYR